MLEFINEIESKEAQQVFNLAKLSWDSYRKSDGSCVLLRTMDDLAYLESMGLPILMHLVPMGPITIKRSAESSHIEKLAMNEAIYYILTKRRVIEETH